MIASIEEPSTNAPATVRGADGPVPDGGAGAGCTTSRSVEGSSVGEIKLVLRPCKPYYRRLTLMRSASGTMFDVVMDVRDRYAVSTFTEPSRCFLNIVRDGAGFIGVSETVFRLSADEVRQVLESFPTIRVRRS